MTLEDVSVLQRTIWFAHSVLRQFVAVIVGYTISMMFGEKLTDLMTWHYLLMSSGIILCMFEGILLLSSFNHFSEGIRKLTLNLAHGWFMGIGFLLMTLGIIFAYIEHYNGHFTTTHGIMGLVSWILCVVSSLGGLLAYHSFKLKEYIRPLYLRFGHTFIGLAGFLLSIATAVTGFYEFIDWTPTHIPIMMTLCILIGVGIFMESAPTLIKHLETILTS